MDPQRAAEILGAAGIALVDASGKPIDLKAAKACPVCKCVRRVRSGGFGKNFDLCGECGYRFDELTVQGSGR